MLNFWTQTTPAHFAAPHSCGFTSRIFLVYEPHVFGLHGISAHGLERVWLQEWMERAWLHV